MYISTNQHTIQGHNSQSTLASSSFRASALSALSCEVPNTIVAIQPSIHASDFNDDSAPMIRKYVSQAGSKIVVPYGHGEIDSEDLVSHIAHLCEARIERIDAGTMSHPVYDLDERRVIAVTFPTLPLSIAQRRIALNDHDAFLHSLVQSLPSREYNLLYLSTPPPASPASFRRQHVSFAGDVSPYRKTNGTSGGGLFRHYQFFTPGIFMGYMALLILVPVLIVGLQAINSLQISYKAFEPPMKIGQKQQQ